MELEEICRLFAPPRAPMQFVGPPFNDQQLGDPVLLRELPADLAKLLRDTNGFIAFGGGLHVRGACRRPTWHSLRAAWKGEHALCRLFPEVLSTDIPFAQDCVGDQYMLRDGEVVQLFAEMGEVEHLEMSLAEFFRAAKEDPVDLLCTEPLELFLDNHAELVAGRLLQVHPPFCCDADERQVRDLAADELLRFHAALAVRLAELPDDATLDIDELLPGDRPTPVD